jgi:Uma2 family endonuclease
MVAPAIRDWRNISHNKTTPTASPIMLVTKRNPRTKIGPLDHGHKMSLRAFEFARTEEGYHYELSRGVITVSEVANYYHACIVAFIRNALIAYQLEHPDAIHIILTEMAAKLLVEEYESERHPDIAVYLTKPKKPKDSTVWRTWFPEFVIEVVTERSTDRDYIDKRAEYWSLGIKEYWIVDSMRKQVVVLRRGKSDWIDKRLGVGDVCTTKLLPGFALMCKAIFEAAEIADQDTD